MQVSEQEVPKLLHLLEQASLDDERYDCVLDIKVSKIGRPIG